LNPALWHCLLPVPDDPDEYNCEVIVYRKVKPLVATKHDKHQQAFAKADEHPPDQRHPYLTFSTADELHNLEVC
jgi:hypothetical protein